MAHYYACKFGVNRLRSDRVIREKPLQWPTWRLQCIGQADTKSLQQKTKSLVLLVDDDKSTRELNVTLVLVCANSIVRLSTQKDINDFSQNSQEAGNGTRKN